MYFRGCLLFVALVYATSFDLDNSEGVISKRRYSCSLPQIAGILNSLIIKGKFHKSKHGNARWSVNSFLRGFFKILPSGCKRVVRNVQRNHWGYSRSTNAVMVAYPGRRNTAWVVFPGTQEASKAHWWQNIKYNGWLSQYHKVKNQLHKYLRRNKNIKKLYITGHSQGCAIASRALETDNIFKKYKPYFIGQGCPKLRKGTQKAICRIRSQIYRTELRVRGFPRAQDVVTSVGLFKKRVPRSDVCGRKRAIILPIYWVRKASVARTCSYSRCRRSCKSRYRRWYQRGKRYWCYAKCYVKKKKCPLVAGAMIHNALNYLGASLPSHYRSMWERYTKGRDTNSPKGAFLN